ncbi:mRNA export factor GLE1 [Planococcus citri]|uniref:mRNA export factor GLE1 n=1 Tax=Planococcus citri TaxID=170843 RepID=UPI0031F8F61E
MTKDIADRFEDAQNQILLNAINSPNYLNRVTIGPSASNAPFEYYDESCSPQPQDVLEPPEASFSSTQTSNTISQHISPARALHELDNLRKAGVKDDVNRFAQKFTNLELELQDRMRDELRILSDEMDTRNTLKRKLTEISVSDDDLPISRRVSALMDKYKQEKQMNEAKKQEELVEIENRHRQAIQAACLEYKKIYDSMAEETKKCKNRNKLVLKVQDDSTPLKELNAAFNTVCNRAKTSGIKQQDVEACNMILQHFKQLSNRIKEKIAEIDLEEQRIEEEKQKKAVEEQRTEPAPVEVTPVAETLSTTDQRSILDKCINKECHKFYIECEKILNDFTEKVQPFRNNKSLNKLILKTKVDMNTCVNATASFTPSHLRDKFDKLCVLLRRNLRYQSNIDAAMAELYYPFCVVDLTKKFIDQGDGLIPTKPEYAFAFASLILALWVEFENFGDLLLGNFMKKCPYTIPAYWPQFSDQTDKEYYLKLGYRYNDDGVVEDQNSFLKRMTGMLMLYTAIMISEPRHGKPHPHGIRFAWRWLAAALNLEPNPDITATLLHEFLKLAGHKLSQCYGEQFWKLIRLLNSEYYAEIDKITPDSLKGPVSRLKIFVEDSLKRGRFPEPKGILSPNFW